MATSSSRRITFAPLPIPRRQVLLTDDGVELPLTPDPDSKLDLSPNPSNHPNDGPACIPAYFSLQAISAPKSTSPSPSSGISGSATSESSGHSSSSSSSSSASSVHSLTPTQSIEPNGSVTPTQSTHSTSKSSRRKSSDLFTKIASKKLLTEQILTLGTINLFRSNKGKNKVVSDDTPPSAWSGLGLTRWSSGGETDHTYGAPLTRSQSTQSTQSTQTYKGGNVRKAAKPADSSKNAARANGLISTLHSDNNKGRNRTRMLNGRVYGARRGSAPNSNPFANVRDEDPEFVEWGYGGMGSVKNDGVGGTVWGRVMSHGTGLYDGKGNHHSNANSDPNGGHRRATTLDETGRGAARGVGGAAEDDDGSGMGWVKRRREQRERERKEREEKEKAEVKEKGKEEEKTEASSGEENKESGSESTPSPSEGKASESEPSISKGALSEEPQSMDESSLTDSAISPASAAKNDDNGHRQHKSAPLDFSSSTSSSNPPSVLGSRNPPRHRHSHDSGTVLSRPLSSNASAMPTSILASSSQDSSASTSSSPTRSHRHSHSHHSHHDHGVSSMSAPTSPTLAVTASATPLGQSVYGSSAPGSGGPTPSPLMTGGTSTPMEEHVTTVQNVPYKHRHHHHHSHSRGKSLDMKEREKEDETEESVAHSLEKEAITETEAKEDDKDDAENQDEIDLSASAASISTQPSIGSSETTTTSSSSFKSSSSDESGSPSESESDGNESGAEESDDDDEEDEEDEKSRKTSLGAGVEKISRHK